MELEEKYYWKETNVLHNAWFDLEASVRSRLDQLSFEFVRSRHPELTEEQQQQCTEALRGFYIQFSSYLDVYQSWNNLIDLLDKSSRFVYSDGSNFIGPFSDVFANIAIEEHVDNFIQEIKGGLTYNIQREILDAGNFFSEILALSNNEIIDLVQKSLEGKGSQHQIKYLIRLKELIRETGSLKYFIDFSEKEKIFRGKRDVFSLFVWIDNSILNLIQPIEFKSKDQIAVLSKMIDRVAEIVNDPSIKSRLATLVTSKSHLVYEAKPDKDAGRQIKKNAKPSEIIRHLIEIIQNFNKRYKLDVGGVKLWICFLFLDMPGFSLSHIQKAPQRKKNTSKTPFKPSSEMSMLKF